MAESTTIAPETDTAYPAAMHEAMRAAINTRKATYDDLNAIFKKYGGEGDLDKPEVDAALAWAADEANDPNQIPIYTKPIGATPELSPIEQGLLGAEISAREPTFRDVSFNTLYDLSRFFGANPETAQLLSNLTAGTEREIGLLDLTPFGLLTGAEEGAAMTERGYETGGVGTTALGGLQTGLSILGAVPFVGGVAKAGGRLLTKAAPGMSAYAATNLNRLSRAAPIETQALQEILTRPSQVADMPIARPAAGTTPPLSVLDELPPPPSAAAELPPAPLQAAPETLPTPDWVTLTPEQRRATLEYRMAPPNQAGTMEALAAQGLTKPTFSTEFNRTASKFAADYLNAAGLTRPENVPFTKFFMDHLSSGTLPIEQTTELLRKYQLDNLDDIASAFSGYRISAEQWGRDGQILRTASGFVPKEAADLAREGLIDTADPTLWRRMGNVQRGLLVSQIATTMRNNISSVGRMGLDTLINLVDDGINISLNPVRKAMGQETITPTGAFSLITQRFNPTRNAELYRQLRNASPKINSELLATYSSDIVRKIKPDAFGKIEKGVDMLNIFNRVSETAIRKMGFSSFLKREVDRAGGVVLDGTRYSFDDLVDNNMVHMIPDKHMKKALERTLDLTYSNKPKSDLANKIIDVIERTGPIGAAIIPFPRFIANAMRFQFDHSPAGLLKLLSKKQRQAVIAGDTEVLSKAAVGSAMLYAAYEFQNSEYAGSKWYTAKLPNGMEIDLRPFFPAAPYLLVADVVKRITKGENVDLAYTAKDIVQGLTGAQFRAGAGLYAIDEFFRDLMGSSDWRDKAAMIPAKIAANYAASLLTPFSTFKDVYAQFEPEEAIYRDTSQDPLAAALRPVPGMQRALGAPEQEYASREGYRATQQPILRQLLGVTLSPEANTLEKEMRRLGFEEYDLVGNTGLKEVDREQKRLFGAIAEPNADLYFNSPEYKNADIVTKTEMFKEFRSGVREAVRDIVNQYNPDYAGLMWFSNRPREEKIRINDEYRRATGKSFVQFTRQLIAAPMVTSDEMFNSLPKGAKFTDPGDYKVYTKK